MFTLQTGVALINFSLEKHVNESGFSLSLSYNSMENLEKKFDKMLSLQVLDKSKAIAHILQEVCCF